LVPFRCGLFNIGVSGQMMFGAIIAIIIGQHMGHVAYGLGQILMLIISILAATSITAIIGLLKAF
jgi:simple sugar transport system permease protein